MNHKEYRVVHKTPGVMVPFPVPSMTDAVDYIRRAERYLSQPGVLKIQSRTVTEWEDV